MENWWQKGSLKKEGKNNEHIQLSNRSLILRLLSQKRICTRAELAIVTGLTQAAITKIVAELIDTNVIREIGLIEGKLGRRSIGITLNADNYNVIAVKIARKSFSVGVFNLRGELVEQVYTVIDGLKSAENVLEQIKLAIREYLQKHQNVYALGIAVPGPYLSNEGRVAVMSEFFGWENLDIRDEFCSTFDLPIYFEHDANAGALALWHYGGYDASEHVLVHFLASEGIGAGIVENGHVQRGCNGIAGEVGHMSIDMNGIKCVCGNHGCLETFCSALSFARWVKEDLRAHPESSLNSETSITAKTIFEHMHRGDDFCIEEVRKVGVYIGYGMANIVNIYDPNRIVMTDIMTGGGETMLESIRETVKDRVLPVLYDKLQISIGMLEQDAILVGAATIAIQETLKHAEQLYKNTPSGTMA